MAMPDKIELKYDPNIGIVRLPGYSPDFMPVEALWHWLRQSVTYNHCH
jgi:transposase